MTKKEFTAKIDAIIWAETPEQQKMLINELYKNTAAKNCNLQNVSGLLFDFLFYVRGGTQDVPEDEIRREIDFFLANYKR